MSTSRRSQPVPFTPPEVVVLPPTERAGWVDPPELEVIRAHFNAGQYRACVEPIEALFFARRNTFHQGLLMYVVALHQLGLGLVRTPRGLLTQALEFWSVYPDWQEGVDLGAVREHAAALRNRLPEGLRSAPANEIDEWWLPPPVL